MIDQLYLKEIFIGLLAAIVIYGFLLLSVVIGAILLIGILGIFIYRIIKDIVILCFTSTRK